MESERLGGILEFIVRKTLTRRGKLQATPAPTYLNSYASSHQRLTPVNSLRVRFTAHVSQLRSNLRASSGLRKDLSSPLGDVIDADLIAPIAAKGSASDSDGP